MADQTLLDLTAIQARATEAATAMRHWHTHGGTAGVTYVAASAEDVPALIAEIQRLRAQRDAVLALCDNSERDAREYTRATGDWCDADVDPDAIRAALGVQTGGEQP